MTGDRGGCRIAPFTATSSEPFDRVQHRSLPVYDAGVPLPYIRDILGHVDLSTTEIYARASTEAKRRALEAVYVDIVSDDLPE
ncbi:integrase/recombinase, partial [mine drainage metagenome]